MLAFGSRVGSSSAQNMVRTCMFKLTPKSLAALRLTLWQDIQLQVEVSVRTNMVGEETNRYRFLRALS